jgi:hypothetical protein
MGGVPSGEMQSKVREIGPVRVVGAFCLNFGLTVSGAKGIQKLGLFFERALNLKGEA